jgi:hypothetical protein
MRTLASIVVLCLVPASAYAQNSSTPQSPPSQAPQSRATVTTPQQDIEIEKPSTLFGDTKLQLRHSGWYIGASAEATSMNGNGLLTTSLRGAWLINRTFGIGLAGAGLGYRGAKADADSSGMGRHIDGGYGGLLLEYIIGSTHVVHGVVDATIGAGGFCVRRDDASKDDCSKGRAFFMGESTANLEVNVLKFMRVTLGGGYRFTNGPSVDGVSGSDLSGPLARFALKFGDF